MSTMKDMQTLAEIHFKDIQGESLTRDDLVFLYELDHKIQSTGYQRDPRIEEIRAKRKPLEDAPIVFGCRLDQIATSKETVNQDTKAYIGPLFPGVFDKLQRIEHVYTVFPERKITRERLQIGGEPLENLMSQLEKQNVYVSKYAQDMLKSKDFKTLPKPEYIDLVQLRVADLGFTENTTTEQLFAKIKEYGLELVPAETGSHYRLAHMDQPEGDIVFTGMRPLADRRGYPYVFAVDRLGGRRWLDYRWTLPVYEWRPRDKFMFRLRKLES